VSVVVGTTVAVDRRYSNVFEQRAEAGRMGHRSPNGIIAR
jgi:hypothetical protein